ncbi:hypothetical protein HH213_08590 [Duganella dendranthematis]|uniref:Uncharacterized protein n=1 Tax=Duganella dendranthematis TaxID=2728021 RepID=A0ABX6M754_9BURK|nr:hypothetical protein [Duganella dendranthematis]QJD90148.1 hypothetical protein HH213_08590 [Duganella dendranthematis]
MNEFNKKIGDLISSLWMDESSKKDFVKNPHIMMEKYGIFLSGSTEIIVLIDTPDLANFILPEKLPVDDAHEDFLRKNLVWFCRGSTFRPDDAKYFSPIRMSYNKIRSVYDRIIQEPLLCEKGGEIIGFLKNLDIPYFENVKSVNVRQNSTSVAYIVIPLAPAGASSEIELRKAARANDWVTYASFISYLSLAPKQ